MKILNIIILIGFLSVSIDSVQAQVIGLNIGNEAPELNFWNQDSTKQIALSSLRGKIILVDFWASWCGGCRIDNTYLVPIYRKYKSKEFKQANGFDVYSVSLDYKRTNWVSAISHDSLEWNNQVSDLKGWNSQAATLYSITAIPANFLVDENGIIIGKNFTYSNGDLDTTLNNLLKNTAANQYQNKDNILICPNPTNSNISIRSLDSLGEIKIYNSVGQLISQQIINSSKDEIELNQQQAGVYYLKIQTRYIKIIKN